jgi:hypothetical protein
MVPDLSYGSHFFQDLVETGIAYAALFPDSQQCRYYPERLPTPPMSSSAESAVNRAVQVHDLQAQHLQLTGDVVRQQLVCYFTD